MSVDSPPFHPTSPVLGAVDPGDLATLESLVPLEPPYTVAVDMRNPTEEAVRELFHATGGVTRVHVVIRKTTGKPSGVVYVDFDTRDHAMEALLQDGKVVNGHAIKANVAPPRAPKQAGPVRGGKAGGRGGGPKREPRGDRPPRAAGFRAHHHPSHSHEEAPAPTADVPAERPKLVLKKRTAEIPVGAISEDAVKSGVFGDARPKATGGRGGKAGAGRGSKPPHKEGGGPKRDERRGKAPRPAREGAPEKKAEAAAPDAEDFSGARRRGRVPRGTTREGDDFSSPAGTAGPENKFAGFADSDDE
jgi:hypothetical protein